MKALKSDILDFYREICHQPDRHYVICELLLDELGIAVDYRILSVSTYFEILFHHSLTSDFIGKWLSEIPAKSRAEWMDQVKSYASVVIDQQSKTFEYYSSSLDKNFSVNSFPLAGQQFGVVFSEPDQKPTDPTSTKIDEKFILNSMIDGLVFQNSKGEIEFFNNRALEILGCTEGQMLGKTSFDSQWKTIYPDGSNYPGNKHPMVVTLLTGKRIENELMGIKTGADAQRWISVSTSPIRDSSGNLKGAIALFRDVTAKEKRRKKPIKTEETNRFLMENMSDMMAVLSKEGKYQTISSSFENILGIQEDELIGQFIYFNVNQDDLIELKQVFQVMLESKKEIRCSYRIFNKHNIPIWIETIFKPVVDTAGVITIIIANSRNIEKTKYVEEHLLKLNENLNRSNEELAEFAYVASHDLQEPLRMISSFTQLLENEYGPNLDEQARRYIYYALSSAKKMKILIDDLLKYSRINTAGMNYTIENMRAVSEEVLVYYEDRIKSGELVVENTIADIRLPMAQSLISRVFQNLIDNAYKFKKSSQFARIHLTSEINDEFLVISIKDNGIGIDKDFHSIIFKIFQRLHRVEEYQGTGIGLALVKRIIERHGGKVWVVSKPDKGASFSFSLPLNQET